MSSEKNKEIKSVAAQLLVGILSNPNYNFENMKKAISCAIDHARELLLKASELVESEAKTVAKVADKVGDFARGFDDDKPKEDKKDLKK